MTGNELLAILGMAVLAAAVTAAGAIQGHRRPGPCIGKRCGD